MFLGTHLCGFLLPGGDLLFLFLQPSPNSFSNFNLKIRYPPPHERLIWKYEKANADLIKRAMKDFDWENKLSFIDINDQVALFDETNVNITSNFIPSETMIFDDRESPWLN